MNKVNERAIRDDAEKPRMALIPPRAIREVGKALTYGAKHYKDQYNYLRGGMTTNQLLSACQRHMLEYQCCNGADTESNVHHIACAAANLLMLMEGILLDVLVDDRYDEMALTFKDAG